MCVCVCTWVPVSVHIHVPICACICVCLYLWEEVYENYSFLFLLQPYAWAAREFLRKMLVGKDIHFVVDYKVPNSGREYGSVWLSDGRNVTDVLLSEGLVEVRQAGARPSEYDCSTIQLKSAVNTCTCVKYTVY